MLALSGSVLAPYVVPALSACGQPLVVFLVAELCMVRQVFCYQPYCASCQLFGGSGSQIWDAGPPFGCVGLGLGCSHILELSAAGGS